MHAFQYDEHFNINITAEVIFLLSLSQQWAEISFLLCISTIKPLSAFLKTILCF